MDDAVHAGIIETMNRTRSSHEVRDATLLKAHDIATMKRTKAVTLNGGPVRDVARGARRPFDHRGWRRLAGTGVHRFYSKIIISEIAVSYPVLLRRRRHVGRGVGGVVPV